MAAYIGFQPSDFFSTLLYTGNASTQVISSIGFNPAITWIKERDGANNHEFFDTVRGDDKHIEPNLNNVEATESGAFAFGTDQFTLGNWTPTNGSGNLTVAWNWAAGTTTGVSGGTLTPDAYSINTTSGCGIYKYGGNSTSGATIAHGLGATPAVVIVKCLDSAGSWIVQHQAIPPTNFLFLNTTAAQTTDSTYWNDTAPTSTVFSLGNGGEVNASGYNYVAYCFAEKKGYSKMGNYRGNAAADGPFVYTGFRPAFVMIKDSESAQAWNTFDDKRSTSTKNTTDFLLQPNDSGAETIGVDGTKTIDLLATGFKVRGLNNEINKNSDTIIYMAFAEFPFVSSNSKPGTAR